MAERRNKKTNISLVRQDIENSLKQRKWFKNSQKKLQSELLSLGEEFNGFLKDLASRPEVIGNVEVHKLVKLGVAKSLVSPVFEVRSLLTNEIFTKDYTSWKFGKYTGYKGILLIEEDGEINKFIIMRKNKFATATTQYEAIGTFDVGFSNESFINLPLSVEKTIQNIVGTADFKIKRYIDLGMLSPDAALSNQQIALFAGVIDTTTAKDTTYSASQKKQYTGNDVEVFSKDRLFEIVSKSDDGYLLSTIARLNAMNILNFSINTNRVQN